MNVTQPPIVSVIMPCYNCQTFVRQAILSILQQTFSAFELIVIDDASTDRTHALIVGFEDPRIRYIRNTTNLGVADSLNRGIHMARGELIARMDADDIAAPERLAKQVDYMHRTPSCLVCGSDIVLINAEGRRIGKRCYLGGDEEIKQNILISNPFAHPATMIRKKILMDYGIRYTKEFPRAEDYDLWLRLADFGEFANIQERLLFYRMDENAIKNIHCKEMLADTIALKIKYWRKGSLRAFFRLLFEVFLMALPKTLIMHLFKLRYGVAL